MRAEGEIRKAYKAIANGDANKVNSIDGRILQDLVDKSWHNPAWTWLGFTQALIWVLELKEEEVRAND